MKFVLTLCFLVLGTAATKSPTRQRFCWQPAKSVLTGGAAMGFNGTYALQECTDAGDHCARIKYVKVGTTTKSPTPWTTDNEGHTKAPTAPTKTPTAPTASKVPTRAPTAFPTKSLSPTIAPREKQGKAEGIYSGCAKQFGDMNAYLPFKVSAKGITSTTSDLTYQHSNLWTAGNPCEMLATQYLHIPNKTIPTSGDICGEIYWTASLKYTLCNTRDANGVCTKWTEHYLNQRYKAIVVCTLDSQGTQADFDGLKGRTGNWTDTDWKECPNGATVQVHFSAAPKATPASALAVFLLAVTGGLLSQW